MYANFHQLQVLTCPKILFTPDGVIIMVLNTYSDKNYPQIAQYVKYLRAVRTESEGTPQRWRGKLVVPNQPHYQQQQHCHHHQLADPSPFTIALHFTPDWISHKHSPVIQVKKFYRAEKTYCLLCTLILAGIKVLRSEKKNLPETTHC